MKKNVLAVALALLASIGAYAERIPSLLLMVS